jgi:hypothetical protein
VTLPDLTEPNMDVHHTEVYLVGRGSAPNAVDGAPITLCYTPYAHVEKDWSNRTALLSSIGFHDHGPCQTMS